RRAQERAGSLQYWEVRGIHRRYDDRLGRHGRYPSQRSGRVLGNPRRSTRHRRPLGLAAVSPALRRARQGRRRPVSRPRNALIGNSEGKRGTIMIMDIFIDGVSDAMVQNGTVRVNLATLAATERDAKGQPVREVRYRLLM